MKRLGIAMAVLAAACQSGDSSDSSDEASSTRDDTGASAPEREPAPERIVKNRGASPLAPIPGRFEAAPWLEGAHRVVAFDSKDGARVVAAGLGWLRLHAPDGTVVAEGEAVGAAHELEVVDVDGDGADDLVVGRGRGRDALEAPASVQVFVDADPAAAETIALPSTSRAEVVGIAAVPGAPGRLWIGVFVSKYQVALIEAERSEDGTWETRRLGEARVAVDLAAGDVDGDGTPELAIARPYGDTLEARGDVLVLEDGERRVVPSRRGARAVLAAPREDGPDLLVFTDGWHREYGAKAQALVTRARRDGAGWDTAVLAHTRDRHGYDRLRLADTDGDGAPEVLAAGDGPAVLVPLAAPVEDEVPSVGSAAARDAFAFDLDGDGADEVIVVGTSPGVWRRAKSR